MMNGDGVLKIPLQINGGTVKASELPTGLRDRELFIDTASGMLYYGDEKGNSHILTVRDYNHGGKLFNFASVRGDSGKSGGCAATIGGLSITNDTTTGGYTFTPCVEYKDGKKVVDLAYKVKFSGIKLGNLVVTNDNYGNTLPATGEEGQIYFLIP